MESKEALAALAREVSAKRMTLADALMRAFVCGLNAALHVQQDREAEEIVPPSKPKTTVQTS
jgi:hypothetical protein